MELFTCWFRLLCACGRSRSSPFRCTSTRKTLENVFRGKSRTFFSSRNSRLINLENRTFSVEIFLVLWNVLDFERKANIEVLEWNTKRDEKFFS